MRSPAGYIYSTPVRIHCGKCNSLLTGNFISDNENIEAYFTPSNCEEVSPQDYEYYGEASGEMICNKIEHLPGKYLEIPPQKTSPIFSFLSSGNLSDNERFIDFACHLHHLDKNWDSQKIKYDLFLNKHFELIKSKYLVDAKKCGYELNTDYDVLRFVYYSFFFDCGGIFKQSSIKKQLIDINHHFRHLDPIELKKYIDYLNDGQHFDKIQKKIFDIMFSFVKIVKHLIPAIHVNLFNKPNDIDKEKIGITTCTFEDIKHFYQDTFESLAECCDIAVGLDNIDKRKNFNTFANNYDMIKFSEQSKGNKVKFLSKEEFFSKSLNLSSNSNELRNAIGHNNYSYNGINQEITYTIKKDNKVKKEYLLDVAIECVQLMQSIYILMFYIYELLRTKEKNQGGTAVLHPIFYSHSKSQDHCPCGSNKKFKVCCKNHLNNKKKIKGYPKKANMRLELSNKSNNAKDFLNILKHS